MVPKQICHGSACHKLPPLYANYPWLVDRSLDRTGDQTDFYTLPDQHQLCQIPELSGRRIRGYFHGWVILSNNVIWSLWNPITCKIIHLPPLTLEDGQSVGQCCLLSPPDDPNSVLLLTISGRPTFAFCLLNSRRKGLNWMVRYYGRQFMRITGYDGFLENITFFNGKIYALTAGRSEFLVQVDIVVKDGEVVIKLLLFGRCPFPSYNCCPGLVCFLKGSSTELFYILVAFNESTNKKTLGNVYLFKWIMSSMRWKETKEKDLKDFDMIPMMWEEMAELKDSIFFIDLARDHLVFYRDAVASELGGYIHIRGETGKMIHSFHVEHKTISLSSMLSPTSRVPACRLKGDPGQDKCKHHSKQEDNDDKIIVKSITDDEVKLNESHLLNISFDILEMITEICVGVEYMNFRATCKRCHLAAPLIQWSNKAALRRLQKYQVISPWLIVVDQNRGIITFTDPMFGDKYFMKKSQVSIRHNRICCCRFGWLLFDSSVLLSLVFFNPFTSDIHKLPPTWFHFDSLCFSAPPTSPDCVVIGFSNKSGDHRVYIHFVAGTQEWHMIPLDFGGAGPGSFCFPTFYGRDLYALSNKGELYAIKNLVKGQDYSWKKVATAKRGCGQYFLVKCNQNLLLVAVGDFFESIEVFKLNDHTKKWEKIECLGRHMLYVSRATCLCIEAKTQEMENKIYFPRLHSNNGKIVFYSLETGMFHSFNDKNIEENCGVGIEHVYPHTWIEPSWS